MNNILSKKYAEFLVKESIFIINEEQPFTWTSGLVMPFYCDQRAILGNQYHRQQVLQWLVEFVKTQIHQYKECALVGVVTAGVPWATMLAQELNLPLGYVRGQKKEHGKKNALEGNFSKDLPIILVEDLVSTAKSLNQAYALLVEEGYKISQAISLFSYNFKSAQKTLKDIGLPLFSLSNFHVLNTCLKKPMHLTKEQGQLFEERNS